MAIHEDVPGIEVSVCIESGALGESDLDNEKVRHKKDHVVTHHMKWTVTKSIVGTIGEAITVNYAVDRSYKFDCAGLFFGLYVNRRMVVGRYLPKHIYNSNRSKWTHVVQGPSQLSDCGIPLLFEETNPASNTEEPTLNDSKAPNQVTKLIVRVYKASAATFIADGKDNKVDTKKAIVRRSVNMMLSPRTELAVDDTPKSNPSVPQVTFTKLDGEDYPIAIFRFAFSTALPKAHLASQTPQAPRAALETPQIPHTPQAPRPGQAIPQSASTPKTAVNRKTPMKSALNDSALERPTSIKKPQERGTKVDASLNTKLEIKKPGIPSAETAKSMTLTSEPMVLKTPKSKSAMSKVVSSATLLKPESLFESRMRALHPAQRARIELMLAQELGEDVNLESTKPGMSKPKAINAGTTKSDTAKAEYMSTASSIKHEQSEHEDGHITLRKRARKTKNMEIIDLTED